MQMSKTNKKILFVITKSNWGGAQKYVFDLATSLHTEGWIVKVAVGGQGDLVDKLKEEKIEVITLNSMENDMNIFVSIASLFELYMVFRKVNPDVVHLNSSKIGLFGGIAGKLAGVRSVIFTAHGWPFSEDRSDLSKKFLRVLMKFSVLLSKKTICVSKSTKSTLDAPDWVKNKLTVIYNGISAIDFKKNGAFFEDFHCAKKEELAIISIGELHSSKGFDLALIHLSKLTHLSWEWHIIGEGKEREHLEKQIIELELQDRVYLHGHVSVASQYLASFDVFFLPSRTEALAYVAIEAIQTNLPIIASNAGGIPEVLRRDPGTTFISIRDANTPKIIEKALRNKAIPVTPESRASLRKEFSLEHMVKETKKYYLK